MRSASSYMKHGFAELKAEKRRQLAQRLLEGASEMIRDGNAADALILLDTLPEPSASELRTGSFERQLLRKKAQCLQALGQSQAAESRLQLLADLSDFDESIEALADLGLLAGGFSILYSVVPGKTQEEQYSLATALERGRAFFEQAVQRDSKGEGTRSRNAHFALGVIHAVGQTPDPARAVRHLNAALAGMLKDSLSVRARKPGGVGAFSSGAMHSRNLR